MIEQVIDEIVKHGVVVKVDKIVDDNYVTEERRYVGDVVKLDFTEHDKVFEDKIAELENIINHKLGDWDKHGITYQEILDMKAENQELKQRIAELESKETETQSGIDTSTPIDCANSLINHLTHLEAFLIAPERYERTFDIDDLEQIAEHLLVYCKHNKESE